MKDTHIWNKYTNEWVVISFHCWKTVSGFFYSWFYFHFFFVYFRSRNPTQFYCPGRELFGFLYQSMKLLMLGKFLLWTVQLILIRLNYLLIIFMVIQWFMSYWTVCTATTTKVTTFPLVITREKVLKGKGFPFFYKSDNLLWFPK